MPLASTNLFVHRLINFILSVMFKSRSLLWGALECSSAVAAGSEEREMR